MGRWVVVGGGTSTRVVVVVVGGGMALVSGRNFGGGGWGERLFAVSPVLLNHLTESTFPSLQIKLDCVTELVTVILCGLPLKDQI